MGEKATFTRLRDPVRGRGRVGHWLGVGVREGCDGQQTHGATERGRGRRKARSALAEQSRAETLERRKTKPVGGVS